MLSFSFKQVNKLPKSGSMSAVARVLGVPVPTVRRWIVDQNAPATKQLIEKNTSYIITKTALIAWLKETKRIKYAAQTALSARDKHAAKKKKK